MPFGGLLTVGLIAAGTEIYAAHKQSSAAKQATEAQTAAGEKALALQKEMYQTTRGDLAPYRNAGVTALGDKNGLMALLGLPSGTLGQMGGGGAVGTGTSPFGPQEDPQGNQLPPENRSWQAPPYQSPSYGAFGGQPPPVTQGVGNSSYGLTPQGVVKPQMVQVRGGNGLIYNVPWDKVDEAKAHGGTVVSNA